MADFYVKVGDGSRFSKTVGEYDVYGFAGITGDFSPNHVDKAYMEKSSYGRLQAHGTLVLAREMARQRAAKACSVLSVFPASPAKALLTSLPDRLLSLPAFARL